MVFDIIMNGVRALMIFIQNAIFSLMGLVVELTIESNCSFDLKIFKACFGDPEVFNAVRDVFKYAGLSIVFFLLIFHGIMVAFGNTLEMKDTIFTIVWKTFFAVAIVSMLGSVTDKLGEYATQLDSDIFAQYTEALNCKTDDSGSADWKASLEGEMVNEESFDIDADDEKSKDEEAEKFANSSYWGSGSQDGDKEQNADSGMAGFAKGIAFATGWVWFIALIKLILNIIMWAILGYNYMRLAVNLIRRYATFGVLTLTAPLFGSMVCSAETENIFKTWLKMYGTQIGIIIMTKLWLNITVLMLSHQYLNFFGFFMIVAFINVGINMESLARDLGFSTSNQGGALLDSVVATGFIMGRAAFGIHNANGNIITGVGTASGNANMVKHGLRMTGGLTNGTPENIAKAMANSPLSKMQTGLPTSSQIKNAEKLIGRGGLIRNADLVNSLTPLNGEGRKQLFDGVLNSNLAGLKNETKTKGLDLAATGEYDPLKGFGVKLTDKNGNTRLGFVSDNMPRNGNGNAFLDSEGKNKYLNLESPQENVAMNNPIPLGNAGEKFDRNVGTGMTSGEMIAGIQMDNMCMKDLFDPATGGYRKDDDASHYFAQQMEDGSYAYYHAFGDTDTMSLCGYSDNRKTLGTPQHNLFDAEDSVIAQFNEPKGIFNNVGLDVKEAQEVGSDSEGNKTWAIKGTDSRGRAVEARVSPSLGSITEAPADKSSHGWSVFDMKSNDMNNKNTRNSNTNRPNPTSRG